jgi:hypothetical protein
VAAPARANERFLSAQIRPALTSTFQRERPEALRLERQRLAEAG